MKESEGELRGGEIAHIAVLEPSVLRGVKGGAAERAAAVLERWEEVRPRGREAADAKAVAALQLGKGGGKRRVEPAKRGGRKGR